MALEHNVLYNVTIIVINCIGETSAALKNIEYVTCDFPTSPINGSVSDYLDNRIGATVTYQCNDGFIPSVEMTAICSNETVSWLPAPDQHVCIFFVEATVNLDILERNITRPNIDCPGDTLSYNCSVVMNTDRVDLTWIITLPGQIPISITYDDTSVLNCPAQEGYTSKK